MSESRWSARFEPPPHRDRFGVEPICRALQFAPSTYYARKERERNPCARALRDRELLPEIRRVHEENLSVYGAERTWRALGREGIAPTSGGFQLGCPLALGSTLDA